VSICRASDQRAAALRPAFGSGRHSPRAHAAIASGAHNGTFPFNPARTAGAGNVPALTILWMVRLQSPVRSTNSANLITNRPLLGMIASPE
jgi:hypothetical protein